MRRLFVETLTEEGSFISLDRVSVHHARVLRLTVGSDVTLFDGRGSSALARIEELDGEALLCRILSVDERMPSTTTSITLVQSMPKGEKLEAIVRATTEIGVDEIRLAISERTIARPDAARSATKLERLSRVAREAARQSERSTVPTLFEPMQLNEVLAGAPAGALHLVFAPGAARGIDAIRDRIDDAKAVWVWVGPEGGFSPAEVEMLEREACIPVRIFDSVLRVETAAPVAVALVRSAVVRSR